MSTRASKRFRHSVTAVPRGKAAGKITREPEGAHPKQQKKHPGAGNLRPDAVD